MFCCLCSYVSATFSPFKLVHLHTLHKNTYHVHHAHTFSHTHTHHVCTLYTHIIHTSSCTHKNTYIVHICAHTHTPCTHILCKHYAYTPLCIHYAHIGTHTPYTNHAHTLMHTPCTYRNTHTSSRTHHARTMYTLYFAS